MSREYDVLLFGATGWTGVHLVEYFAQNYPPETKIKWAMCGRSKSKLDKVVKRLKGQGFDWIPSIACIEVDIFDEMRVLDVVSRANVVATVIGPYAKYGETLVKACIDKKTHYCDITGETYWVGKMIEKYNDLAVAQQTFIVPSCGFDSVPSDLGTRTLVDFMNTELGEQSKQVRGYFLGAKRNNLNEEDNTVRGGGGTVLSLLGAVGNMFTAFRNPYFLTGKDDINTTDVDHSPQLLPGREKLLGEHKYTTCFLMAFINEQTVRRSNYLLKGLYGKSFSYHEASAVKSYLKALSTSLMLLIGLAILKIPFLPRLLLYLAPKPSSWPPQKPKHYKPGSFEFAFVGESESGKKCVAKVVGKDEPGWAETSKMLGESALVLALATEKVRRETKLQGGFITPALLYPELVKRLRAKGMVFTASLAQSSG